MTAETQTAATAPVRVVPPLHERFFFLESAGQKVRVWVAAPPVGVVLDDMLRPEFWAHVARKLEPLAQILVFPEDGTWEAELRVRDTAKLAARVSVIRHTKWPDPAGLGSGERYEIEYRGPAHRYCIRRKSDNEIVEVGFATKEAAAARIPELLKAAA